MTTKMELETDKTDIFDEARNTINGPRAATYGPAIESFESIGRLWTTYLDRIDYNKDNTDLTPEDVANMMILMKVSRAASGEYHRDNYVDIIGYAGLASQMIEGTKKNERTKNLTSRT